MFYTSTSQMRLISDQLTCVRGGRVIFKALSFDLSQGQGVLLLGPNGAGKTSLLRLLAGFIPAAQGMVVLEDGDPERTLGEQCHYVGHLPAIKDSFTVLENLDFWVRYHRSDTTQGGDIDTALAAFGLEDLRAIPAGLLSAGQKKRLSLARLLASPRPLWLLDEPSVSLDKKSGELLAQVMKNHMDKGGLLIAASHLPLGIEFTQTLTMDRQNFSKEDFEYEGGLL